MEEVEMSQRSCHTCGRQLTKIEDACGDGNCAECFKEQNSED